MSEEPSVLSDRDVNHTCGLSRRGVGDPSQEGVGVLPEGHGRLQVNHLSETVWSCESPDEGVHRHEYHRSRYTENFERCVNRVYLPKRSP